MLFIDMLTHCAPDVAPQTMAAIVRVESSHNPYAIGVVGGSLKRQPTSLEEALATVKKLEAEGRNFSMGLAQVNRYNMPRYKLTYKKIFNPCDNLRAGSLIIKDCYIRAADGKRTPQQALRAAFSCYYSGNFTRGFRPDKVGDKSYVDKVLLAASVPVPSNIIVPAIDTSLSSDPKQPQSNTYNPQKKHIQSFDVFESKSELLADNAIDTQRNETPVEDSTEEKKLNGMMPKNDTLLVF